MGKKFLKQAKKRQNNALRALSREKRDIFYRKENNTLENFKSCEAYKLMYDLALEDLDLKWNGERNVSDKNEEKHDLYDKLDTSSKKLYNQCRKYIIYNKYLQMIEINKEIELIRSELVDFDPFVSQKNELKQRWRRVDKKDFDTKNKLKRQYNNLMENYENEIHIGEELRDELMALNSQYNKIKERITQNEEDKKTFKMCKSIYNASMNVL